MGRFARGAGLLLAFLTCTAVTLPAVGEDPWDPGYRRLDDAASLTHHLHRLRTSSSLPLEGLDPATARAVADEVSLRFAYERVQARSAFDQGVEAWREFLAAPRDPLVTALGRGQLGHFLWRLGRDEEAHAEWATLGFLENWALIGPFENERGSGMGQAWPPEQEFDPEGTYAGKRQRVSWRIWSRPGNGGVIPLGEMMHPPREALAYLMTHVHTATARDAVLRLGSTDAYAIFIGETEVVRRDVERPLRFDQDVVPIRLAEGWNRIVIKSGNGQGSWGLRVRLTDGAGAALSDVEIRAELPAEATLAAGGTSTISPHEGALTHLEQARETVDSLRLRGWLVERRHAHDRSEHPDRDFYRRALELDDESALTHYLLAGTYRRQITHSAEREENPWRHALEQCLALDIHFHRARYELARYHWDRFGNRLRAESLLAPFSELASGLPDPVLALSAELLSQRYGKVGARELLAERDAHLSDELLASWRLTRAMEAWREGDLERCESLLRAGLARDATQADLRQRLHAVLAQQGRVDDARGELDRLLRSYPTRVELHVVQADFEAHRQRWDAALEALDRALAIAPDRESLHRRRGEILLLSGRDSAGLVSLDRSLELDPNQPRLREYIEHIRAVDNRVDARHRIPTKDLIASQWERTETANIPARILLDHTVVEIQNDGTTSRYRQYLARVVNDQGIRSLDYHSIPYARGEQWVKVIRARVHHPDGSTEEAQIRNREPRERPGEYPLWSSAWVDLPPLQIGDVVEIESRTEDLRQSFFGDYFGDRVQFAGTWPRDRTIYTLLAPADKELHFHPRRLDVEPVTVEVDGRIGRTWTVTDQEQIEPEPGMPGLAELVPTLEVSTFRDWESFARWYAHLIRKQFESSKEIEAKVRELTTGLDTRLEKVRAIYNFVVTDVRYIAWEFGIHGFKPYKASTIFTRRFGDCKDKATLICTMLDHVGIEAYPVLINGTRSRGEEDFTLPLVQHFNHCIAYVPDVGEGEGLFLDGTAQHHSADQLPMMDRGAKVLVVHDDSGEVAEIPWNRPDELAVKESARVAIGTEGEARVEQRNDLSGDYAVSVRGGLEIEGQRAVQLERLLGSRFPGATVDDVVTSPLDDLDTPVSMTVKYRVPDYLDQGAGEIKLPPLRDLFGSADRVPALASLAERRHDLLVGNPSRSELELVIELPPGYEVAHVPDEVSLDTPQGRYQLSAKAEGRTIRVTRQLELSSPRVTTTDYPAFKRFLDAVDQARDERIVIKRKRSEP